MICDGWKTVALNEVIASMLTSSLNLSLQCKPPESQRLANTQNMLHPYLVYLQRVLQRGAYFTAGPVKLRKNAGLNGPRRRGTDTPISLSLFPFWSQPSTVLE